MLLFVAEFVLLRSIRAEPDQLFVILNPVEDQIVALGHALGDASFPDTAFDTTQAGAALAVLKTQFV